MSQLLPMQGYSDRERDLEERVYRANEKLLETLQRSFESLTEQVQYNTGKVTLTEHNAELSRQTLQSTYKALEDMFGRHIADCAQDKADKDRRLGEIMDQLAALTERLEQGGSQGGRMVRLVRMVLDWLDIKKLIVLLLLTGLIIGKITFDQLSNFMRWF